MNQTGNMGLRMPEEDDFYDVDDFNYNAALIDTKFSEMAGIIANMQASAPVIAPSYFGISNMQILTASGTFNAEAGNIYKIFVIGGGGGGQGNGGFRGVIKFYIHKPEADAAVPCTVGEGGTAGAANAFNGASSSYGSFVSAYGGTGGLSVKFYTSANFQSTPSHSGQNGFILGPNGSWYQTYHLKGGNGYGGGGYGVNVDNTWYTSVGQSGAIVIFW